MTKDVVPPFFVEVPNDSREAAPRLARNIARLSGVSHPDFEQTWLRDPSTITKTDIMTGMPASNLPLGGLASRPLSEPTVTKYGPDQNAALILTGVNYLFKDITDAFSATAGVFEGAPVVAKVGVLSALMATAYKEQPRSYVF